MKDNFIYITPDSVGDALRKRRVQIGLSQTEVAEFVGQQQQTISRIEVGKNAVSAKMLAQVAEVLSADLVLIPRK